MGGSALSGRDSKGASARRDSYSRVVAFVRLAFFPGGTAAHYDALSRELEQAPPPARRKVFAAGPRDDGWQVVQVWDRYEDLADFNDAWFLPALERISGKAFPNPPAVIDFEPTEMEIATAASD